MKSFVHVACVVAMLAGSAAAQDAVQWRVEDGGNGHWYQGVRVTGGVTWVDANVMAGMLGGHLATPTSEEEDQFIRSTIVPSLAPFHGEFGPILGGSFVNGAWVWVTAEPWSVAAWARGEPSSPSGEPYLHYQFPTLGWNDYDGSTYNGAFRTFIVEWSADCDRDDVIDYGQILSGIIADTNTNGIPDCCEASVSCIPCEGDVSGNGVVDGVDLAAVLGAWGSSGKGEFSTDTNGDGFVDGADLATVLSGWGPCP
jgi:hypothetical protein